MGQTHQREAAIFDAAMELPPEQRAAHLDHACGGDAALRQRIESLLNACESACEFLASPSVPAAAQTINVLPASFEKAGDRIGSYKLLQQIGEGGCGVVYVAEQEEPVCRRVALRFPPHSILATHFVGSFPSLLALFLPESRFMW